MTNLYNSVAEDGVRNPIIVHNNGVSNIVIDGWRRVLCCRELELEYIPAIIHTNLSEAEMMLMAIDMNMSHRQLLIRERAWAYRRRMEALKKLNRYGSGNRSQNILAEESQDSGRTINRLIRLTYLIPEWMDLVDLRLMALLPAVELSFLSEDEQRAVYECMCNLMYDNDVIRSTITHAQARILRRMAEEDKLDIDRVIEVLSKPKPNQKDKLHISWEDILPYIPRGYSDAQCRQYIIDLARQEFERRSKTQKNEERIRIIRRPNNEICGISI